MKLTTPELKEYDSVFPGENWFFYWKTSPLLWEAKLAHYQGPGPIFVPIYWGFHSENPGHYDFGNFRPETNLKNLFGIAQSLGRELILIVPLTPAPFLPNGGMPAYLAKTLSLSNQGTVISVLDHESRLNKIYSFFEPNVFQAYRKFTWNLGQYLTQNGIQCEVYGANFGYLHLGEFVSYINDYSVAFEQGFNRYIKQMQASDPEQVQQLLDNPVFEKEYKTKFQDLIFGLYEEAASESLAGNWGKTLSFALLGGAIDDIFSRSSELWDHEANFFKPLLNIIIKNVIPCSVLLSPYLKKGALAKSLDDIVNESFIREKLNNTIYENDDRVSFLPLIFFEIFISENESHDFNELINSIGVNAFFERRFQWTHRQLHSYKVFDEDEQAHKVQFLFGKFLDPATFSDVLKSFMNGAKIFLDIDNLDIGIKKKLNLFINENSIKTENLNFLTNIVKIKLGDGVLLVYDSAKLKSHSLNKKLKFWDKVIGFLDLKHLNVNHDENLYYVWRSRCTNTFELDYEEIRRVSFYNPTSYKKKAQVLTSSNFAFLKTVDQIHSNINSTPMSVDIEILPSGSVSLDFGFYE